MEVFLTAGCLAIISSLTYRASRLKLFEKIFQIWFFRAMKSYVLPNPTFVKRSRDEMRLKLLESLNHLIFDVFGTKFSPPITEPDLRKLVSEGANFPSPVIFALHGAMLNSALKNDTSEVPDFFRILKDIGFRENGQLDLFSITSLSEQAMHRDDVFLLKRAFADDVGLTTTLMGPPQQEVDRATILVNDALKTLEETAPDWMEELSLLANQVYFAVEGGGNDLLFGGAAVFDAFGSVLMNPLGFRDTPTVLMALIHESSHQQMFLYHLNDPILNNDSSSTFSSPLRTQPRPMEGIFHALWVSARMVVAAEAVLKSLNRPVWAEDLAEHQARARTAFYDCEHTVSKHAELSELGIALFESAREAVDAI